MLPRNIPRTHAHLPAFNVELIILYKDLFTVATRWTLQDQWSFLFPFLQGHDMLGRETFSHSSLLGRLRRCCHLLLLLAITSSFYVVIDANSDTKDTISFVYQEKKIDLGLFTCLKYLQVRWLQNSSTNEQCWIWVSHSITNALRLEV